MIAQALEVIFGNEQVRLLGPCSSRHRTVVQLAKVERTR